MPDYYEIAHELTPLAVEKCAGHAAALSRAALTFHLRLLASRASEE